MLDREKELAQLGTHLNEVVNQRNNAEMMRVFGYVQTAYPHLKEVYKSLSTVSSDSQEPLSFTKTMRILTIQLSGNEDFFNKRANAGLVRAHLAEIFSCPYEFERKCWSVNPYIHPSGLTDEVNIARGDSTQKIVGTEELKLVRDLIMDVLEMTGQLARRIHSCEMTRILRTIISVKGKPWYGENLSPEAAAHLADEIVYCYDAIRSEVRLLTPAERSGLSFPKKPRHRPDIIIDTNPPQNLSANEKTKFCRDVAYNRFKKENFHLLPFIDFSCHEFDAVRQTEESVARLEESYKNSNPTLDKGRDEFNYRQLGEVLSADFRLYYDEYIEVEDFDEETGERIRYDEAHDVAEKTPQQEAKERIIDIVRHVLNIAIKLSTESGSTSIDEWSAAQVSFERRDGDFHSYSGDDDDAAEAALESFLTAFRRARQRLWVDWMRHCRNDIDEKRIKTEPGGRAIENIQESVRSIDVNSAQTALNTAKPTEPRDMIIALVRLVNKRLFKGASIPQAINYIRTCESVEEEFKVDIANARQFAAAFAKSPSSKSKSEDGFWNGIAKDAQNSAAKGAAKRKLKKNADPSAPPGPVPTIYGDTGGGLH